MKRPPCCNKSNVKRGLWTVVEDAKMLAYIYAHGTVTGQSSPGKQATQRLNRCGKSCRLRWTNYLRPELKHDGFSAEEEQLIISLHKAIGSRWSLIAQQLPGRTDNDVKNYWNIKLKKKLSKMGIDPLTHKPLSQIISEIGNIKGSSNFNMVQASVPPEISGITGNSDLAAEHVPQDFSPLSSYPLCSPLSSLTGFPPFDSSPDLLPFGQSPFSLSSQRPVISGDMFMKDNGRFPRIPSSLSALPNITLDSILCQGNEAKLAFDNNSEAGSTSSEPSLVDAILESNSKMKSEFPQLLYGFIDY